ncbi:transglutaminase-like cysteine peptidase [Salinicola socius]|uniref:Transglutaminase n=1 Tax=Salinicola socius TaxID=404433 RepID=A0A1Q8SRI2_9GAMM|nr:transglutaminase-like cysteine peptidase [Salinicola socius]OLO03982.1 hypothetical protein BTW07_11930 [Salinicola socius]
MFSNCLSHRVRRQLVRIVVLAVIGLHAVASHAASFVYWDDPTATAITLTRTQFVEAARGYRGEARLAFVNRVVNNAARQQFEKIDTWKGFDRLVRDQYGDCEDFAIAKYQILIDAGTSANRLDFLAADDKLTPTYHAVLRYRRDDGSHLILDNLTPMMLPQSHRTDLAPIVTFDSGKAQIYRDGAFHPVDPARIVLGGQPLSQRLPKLMDY